MLLVDGATSFCENCLVPCVYDWDTARGEVGAEIVPARENVVGGAAVHGRVVWVSVGRGESMLGVSGEDHGYVVRVASARGCKCAAEESVRCDAVCGSGEQVHVAFEEVGGCGVGSGGGDRYLLYLAV